MNRLVIYGNGQLAELALARVRQHTDQQVAGFTVDRACLRADRLHDLPVVPFDEVAERWPPGKHAMLVAVGHAAVNRIRAERYARAKAMGYRFINLISPLASIGPGVELGENCIVEDHCVVQPYCRLGNNVTLGSACILSHHVEVGDHCYLAVRVTVAGNVRIGDYAFLGAGVTVRDRVSIGESAYLGAGVVLLADARPRAVYAAPEPHLLPIGSDRLPSGR